MVNASIKEFIRTMLMMISGIRYFNKQSKILYYHDIHSELRYTNMSTSLKLFIQHIEQIRKSGFDVVKNISLQQKQVQIAFDDGFRGIWDNKDFFIQNKIYPTVFIAISLIGIEGYLTNEEIIILHQLGFNIQSHTVSHCNLTILTDEELIHELSYSKQYLEQLLNKRIEEICVPIGYFSETVYFRCLDSGYSKIYSSIPGNYYDKFDKYDLLIFRNLVQFHTPFQVKLTLIGGARIFQLHTRNCHFIK
jgi:hypothetical protein